jgi:hypothetical protein
MAVTLDAYFPFAAGAGQVTTVAQWEILAPRVGLRNGVVIGDLNEMAVFADATGMQVKVPTGRVVIAGHVGEASTQKALTVSAAHATLTRIDLVVARLDLTNSRIELDVVAGTPGAGVAPALTQTSTVWEIALGRVTVPGADTTIDAGQVLDVRSFARPQGAEIGDGKLVFYNAPANSAEVFFQGQTVSRFTYAACSPSSARPSARATGRRRSSCRTSRGARSRCATLARPSSTRWASGVAPSRRR